MEEPNMSTEMMTEMMTEQELRTVWWEDDCVCMINQRVLPHRQVVVRCHSLNDVAHAIYSMQIRGAPAIGCAAAYGMVLAAQTATTRATNMLLDTLKEAKEFLDAQRPTAINLSWATSRMLRCVEETVDAQVDLVHYLLDEAHAILAEDQAMCHAIGDHGVSLIPERGHVLTHCNAGGLATAGYGTALAPLRTAYQHGRQLHVYVDETRPFLQGARLTTWELLHAKIDQTLVMDNMAGYLMQNGEVDCVLVGADRIVANGDVANKIGTYTLAVLAKEHNLPFYVAAPSSTIDLSCPNGDMIPIEERSSIEVTHMGDVQLAPEGISAEHPAFDVTPHELVTAIITEHGVIYPSFDQGLRQHAIQK
jgi:methylthioribose-1-phosphate isomerase